MSYSKKQLSIAAPVAVEGVGYWSGDSISVEFRPAPPDSGLCFVRRDLPGKPRIPALAEYRVDIPLRTSLRKGDAQVDMVEHVLAALGGMGVSNCEVWVDRPEMPAMDGSSLNYVEAIDSIGLVVQNSPRKIMRIDQPSRLCHGVGTIGVEPIELEKTILEYHLEYAGTSIGYQLLNIELTPEFFRTELAPARTFLLEEEAIRLRQAGLGEHVTYEDLLVFGEDGPIGNELRFADECVRHKLLDMVGDLTLGGYWLQGLFSARRSGHHLNAEMVRSLTASDSLSSNFRRCA